MIRTQYFEPKEVIRGLHIGYLVTKYDDGTVKRTKCSYEKISTIIPGLWIKEPSR